MKIVFMLIKYKNGDDASYVCIKKNACICTCYQFIDNYKIKIKYFVNVSFVIKKR